MWYNPLSETMISLMNSFFMNPRADIFNSIILSDGPLYRTDEDADDENYVDYEGEGWKERKIRIKNALEKKPKHTVIFCHPLKLSWVYAAVRQFPWLIDECVQPMYIERAQKFNDASYHNLVQKMLRGSKEMNRHRIQNVVCQEYTHFVELTLIRYGASGNEWYIKFVDEINDSMPEFVRGDPCGDPCGDTYTKAMNALHIPAETTEDDIKGMQDELLSETPAYAEYLRGIGELPDNL